MSGRLIRTAVAGAAFLTVVFLAGARPGERLYHASATAQCLKPRPEHRLGARPFMINPHGPDADGENRDEYFRATALPDYPLPRGLQGFSVEFIYPLPRGVAGAEIFFFPDELAARDYYNYSLGFAAASDEDRAQIMADHPRLAAPDHRWVARDFGLLRTRNVVISAGDITPRAHAILMACLKT